MRKYDKVSCWGGEEFLLLFPGLKKDTALMRAEAIRKTIEEVVARADEALYLGKNTGKNRVMSLPKK